MSKILIDNIITALLVLALPAWLFMVGVSWTHGKKWPTGRPIKKTKNPSPKIKTGGRAKPGRRTQP